MDVLDRTKYQGLGVDQKSSWIVGQDQISMTFDMNQMSSGHFGQD